MRAAIALVLATACGRLGLETSLNTLDDAASSDGGGDAAHRVAWAKTFVQQGMSVSSLVDTFAASAMRAGDAITFHVFCNGFPNVATGVTLSAPGWTITPIGPLFGSSSSGYWAASFGAIAPDTTPATFTAAWTASGPCGFLAELGDEFTNNDPTGGATTFDAHAETLGFGNCTTGLVTQHADVAVWSGCSVNTIIGAGAGYTKSADDGHGDWSEYRLANDPAQTTEGVSFVTSTGMDGFVVTEMTIR